MASESGRVADGVQFVTDGAGKPTAIILPMARYEALLEELEDLADLVAFYEAKDRETEYVSLNSIRPPRTT